MNGRLAILRGAGLALALGVAVAIRADAAPAAPESGRIATLPPAIATFRPDSAFANGAANYAAELFKAGAHFRAAEWSLALAGAAGPGDRRAPGLLERLSPGALSDEELLLLGEEATRYGRGTGPALVSLARIATRDRRAAASTLAGAARALGADSALVVSAGAGWPPARRLATHTIGILAPLSGRGAARGESFVRGAQLAIAEYNTARWAGAPVARARVPLRLAVSDTRGEAAGGARAAVELTRAGVGALAGDPILEAAIPAAAAAGAAGIPFISTAEGLAELASGIGRGVYTLAVTYDRQVAALASAAVHDLGWGRIAILSPANASAQALSAHFAAEIERQGGRVVVRQSYAAGETNFATPLGAIAAATPDAVFIPGTPRELLAAVPQLSYYEVPSRVLGLEELGDPSVLDKLREYLDPGVFTRGAYGLEAGAAGSFGPAFTARYRVAPDADASRGYVAVRTLAAAFARGATTPAGIAAVLAQRTTAGSSVLEPDQDVARVEMFVVAGATPVKALSSNR
jgi:branched-chain amino acid transport system substrate-binding protein